MNTYDCYRESGLYSLNLESENLGLNHQWCRFLVEELSRQGVTEFVVSPGGRSMALVVAVSENPNLSLTVHPDERGAAFYALGLAKASGVPAVLISTSGTAVANYYPAVLEASTSLTPLIVLTADLPAELCNCGENQTINQTSFFVDNVRLSLDLAAPEKNFDPCFILDSVGKLLNAALASPAGPVHLNCHFRKPLLEKKSLQVAFSKTSEVQNWLSADQAFTHLDSVQNAPEPDISRLVSLVSNAARGVITCGHLPCFEEAEKILDLAEQLSWPLLADISSGVRCTGRSVENIVSNSDLIFTSLSGQDSLQADFILHFGGQPLQNEVNAWLSRQKAPFVVISDRVGKLNPWGQETTRINVSPALVAERLIKESTGAAASKLLAEFKLLDSKVAAVAKQHFTGFSEFETLQEILAISLPEEELFIGNSLAIRALDLVEEGGSKKLKLGFNRGVSGIDGLIATGAGFSARSKGCSTIVVGDMSAFHDLNSLAFLAKADSPITVVLLNNSGGQIFSLLANLSDNECFEQCFVADQRINFKSAAESFGLNYFQAGDIQALREQYNFARKSSKSSLLEVRLPPSGFKVSLMRIKDKLVEQI